MSSRTNPVQTSSTTQTNYSSYYSNSGGNGSLAPMRELVERQRAGLHPGANNTRTEDPKPLTNRAQQGQQAQPAGQDDEEEGSSAGIFAGAAALAGLGYAAYNAWYGPATNTSATTTTSSESVIPVASSSQQAPLTHRERRESQPRMDFVPPATPQSSAQPFVPRDASEDDLRAIQDAEDKARQEKADAQYARGLDNDTKRVAHLLGRKKSH